MRKPPVGLIPEYIWKQHIQSWIDSSGGITASDLVGFKIARIEEIERAITRFEEAGKEIPDHWVEEGVKLIFKI